MKTLLYTVLLAVGTLAAQAQAVPNGNLDTWVTRGRSAAPQGWLIVDDYLAAQLGSPLPVSTNTVTRSTAPRTGAGAAQLSTANFLGQADIPGFMSLGTRLSGNQSSVYNLPSGVPYTGRPARLEFYYKLTGANAATDSSGVAIELTRTVGGVETVVAEAQGVLTTPQARYTLVSLPLAYRASGQPDTLRIGFVSGRTVGTVLTIDDVALAGTATAVRDAMADAALSVYPTSSPSGHYTLAAPAQPAVLASALTVTDLTGRVVLRQPAPATAADTRALALPAGLAPGLYTLRLDAPTGPLTRKLVLGL